MAQGTRGRWVRVAATGFGVLVCTGLVGCMNADKEKDKKLGAKSMPPGPGLPGTQTIGANGPAGRTSPPAAYGSGGIQQTGGFGQSRAGSPGGGQNTLGAPPQSFGNYPNAAPGGVTPLGAPNPNPGFVPSVQPAGAPGGYTGFNTNPGPAPGAASPTSTVSAASPLPPAGPAGSDPLPPPAPNAPAGALAVQPPTAPTSLAPLAPSLPPISAPPGGPTVRAAGQ